MIPIDTIERTAGRLMAKAAIEIPQDYLDGLKTASAREKGDLASFVLQAMLENHEAAKEDNRAMCGAPARRAGTSNCPMKRWSKAE